MGIVLCPTVVGWSSRAAAMISCATEVQFRQTCVRICILLLDFDVFGLVQGKSLRVQLLFSFSLAVSVTTR